MRSCSLRSWSWLRFSSLSCCGQSSSSQRCSVQSCLAESSLLQSSSCPTLVLQASSAPQSPKDFVEADLVEAVLCQDDHGKDQAAKVYLPDAPQALVPTKGFEAGTDCSEAAGLKLKKLQAVYSAPAVQALCPESAAEAEKAVTI